MNQPDENCRPILSLSGIDHAYLGRTVLSRITLDLFRREVVALVGPSGCGKSTLVHIAAGVVNPLRGRVERRYNQHGMVFQEPRLLPWARARDNIAYPLRHRRIGRGERDERVRAAAARAALDPLDLDKFPVEMSGGMRQRTAIARALAMQPDLVYFDEPFTALDVALKRRMQDLVIAASRDASFSALFITHDLTEAARIAHRIVVMDAHGGGILGERTVPGRPGDRTEGDLFRLVNQFVTQDPLFRHIHDIDERRIS
ncbi:ABC transporter ATP-binding protein [Dongia sp.]|uniref:ABC transporter ATP-binding protein n=1 Tax=Dongia sp. TaxID=1977262 RepID=UPI0035B0C96E